MLVFAGKVHHPELEPPRLPREAPPRDAEQIDPQERLFLQHAWMSLEDAGYTRAALQACRGGLSQLPGLLLLLGLVFLVGMLGQGLFISVVTKNQLVATQAARVAGLSQITFTTQSAK